MYNLRGGDDAGKITNFMTTVGIFGGAFLLFLIFAPKDKRNKRR